MADANVTDKGVEKTTLPAASATATPASTNGAGGTQPTSYRYGGKEYSSVEELGKAYEGAQAELGKWTQQHGDLKKQFETVSTEYQKWAPWMEWWKGIQPLWDKDVEAVIRQKYDAAMRGGAQGSQGQPSQAQPAGSADYDLYTPEGVGRFRQALMQELTQGVNARTSQQLGQIVQALNKTLADKEAWYQSYMTNYMSLMRRALEQRQRDPNFNVEAVMERAAKAIGGQVDPLELGQQLIAAEEHSARMDAAKKEAYDLGKRDLEQELANKKQETPPPTASMPKFMQPAVSTGPRKGLHTLREKAAENIFKQFGPQWFAGR